MDKDTADDDSIDRTPTRLLTRKRTCGDCGKPLGSTVGRCYECGGSDASMDREDRLEDARVWKLLLGVRADQIADAHQT